MNTDLGRASTPRGNEHEVDDHCPYCGEYCHATIHTGLGCSTATIRKACKHAELDRGEWEFYSDEDLA